MPVIWESLAEVSASARYVVRAGRYLRNRAELDRVFAAHQPDAVMHLGREPRRSPAPSLTCRFHQTISSAPTCRWKPPVHIGTAWTRLRKAAFRFHHISTDEVYGDLPHPDEVAPVRRCRSLPRRPYAPLQQPAYSASKASADHLVRAWRRLWSADRGHQLLQNNCGPYLLPEQVDPLVILNALDGKPLPVYGKGDQIRDWLYVEDHARTLYTVGHHRRDGRDLQHRWAQREAELRWCTPSAIAR